MASYKSYPSDISSYDLLKTFAIVTMIIDHIGAYMLPEISELRAVGRLSAPVWFFLIGFANTRELDIRFWIGGGILAIGMYLIDGYMLPINILFGFLIIRLTLNPLMKLLEDSLIKIAVFFVPLFFVAYYTMPYVEYGALGYYCAIIGYMARHQKTLNYKDDHLIMLAAGALFFYWANQMLIFGFSQVEAVFVGICFLPYSVLFIKFTSQTYPALTQKLSSFKYPFFLMGRRTLEIYVIHVLLFKAIGVYALGLEL